MVAELKETLVIKTNEHYKAKAIVDVEVILFIEHKYKRIIW